MALSFGDWDEINKVIAKAIGNVGEPFVQGTVIKSDPVKNVVFLKEFADVPIPIVAHHYQVTYNSRDTSGRVVRLKTIAYSNDVTVLVPRPGDIVLVAQHLGTRALPKCLGVIQSKNYIIGE